MMRISSLYGRCRALGRKCMLYGGGLRKKRFGSVFMKDTKKPKEREKSKRKNYREYGRPNGKDGEVAATLFESAK